MKICFPVSDDKGMESPIDRNIMTAKYFFIVDTQTNEIKKVDKTTALVNPLAPLSKEEFDVMVVDSIGKMAIVKMQERRKRVFKCNGVTVSRNTELMRKYQLNEIRPESL